MAVCEGTEEPPGPPEGPVLSAAWPENAKEKKNMEKMAFSVTSAHLCRWMSDGREEGTNKGGLQSA